MTFKTNDFVSFYLMKVKHQFIIYLFKVDMKFNTVAVIIKALAQHSPEIEPTYTVSTLLPILESHDFSMTYHNFNQSSS